MTSFDRVAGMMDKLAQGAKATAELSAEELKKLLETLKSKKIELKPTDASTGRIIANTAMGGVLGAGVGATGGYFLAASMAAEAVAATEVAGAVAMAAAAPLWPILVLGFAGFCVFASLSYFATCYSITITDLGKSPEGTVLFTVVLSPI